MLCFITFIILDLYKIHLPKWWFFMVIYHDRIRKTSPKNNPSNLSCFVRLIDRIQVQVIATGRAHVPNQTHGRTPDRSRVFDYGRHHPHSQKQETHNVTLGKHIAHQKRSRSPVRERALHITSLAYVFQRVHQTFPTLARS